MLCMRSLAIGANNFGGVLREKVNWHMLTSKNYTGLEGWGKGLIPLLERSSGLELFLFYGQPPFGIFTALPSNLSHPR